MKRTIVRVVTAMSALSPAATGCSVHTATMPTTMSETATPATSGRTGTSAAAEPPAETIAYADALCGALVRFAEPAKSFTPDATSPGALVSSLRAFLDDMSAGLATAATDVDAVDGARVPDGARIVAEFRSGLNQAAQSIERAKATASTVDPNDAAAVRRFATEFGAELRKITTGGASLESLERVPALDSALKRAPNCVRAVEMDLANDPSSSARPTS